MKIDNAIEQLEAYVATGEASFFSEEWSNSVVMYLAALKLVRRFLLSLSEDERDLFRGLD